MPWSQTPPLRDRDHPAHSLRRRVDTFLQPRSCLGDSGQGQGQGQGQRRPRRVASRQGGSVLRYDLLEPPLLAEWGLPVLGEQREAGQGAAGGWTLLVQGSVGRTAGQGLTLDEHGAACRASVPGAGEGACGREEDGGFDAEDRNEDGGRSAPSDFRPQESLSGDRVGGRRRVRWRPGEEQVLGRVWKRCWALGGGAGGGLGEDRVWGSSEGGGKRIPDGLGA